MPFFIVRRTPKPGCTCPSSACHRAPGGVLLRSQRQVSDHAFDGINHHARLVAAHRRDSIARPIDDMSEQIETNADIAHTGRRKSGRGGSCSKPGSEMTGHAQQIGENTGRGHLRAGSWSLNNQWVVAVSGQ